MIARVWLHVPDCVTRVFPDWKKNSSSYVPTPIGASLSWLWNIFVIVSCSSIGKGYIDRFTRVKERWKKWPLKYDDNVRIEEQKWKSATCNQQRRMFLGGFTKSHWPHVHCRIHRMCTPRPNYCRASTLLKNVCVEEKRAREILH